MRLVRVLKISRLIDFFIDQSLPSKIKFLSQSCAPASWSRCKCFEGLGYSWGC